MYFPVCCVFMLGCKIYLVGHNWEFGYYNPQYCFLSGKDFYFIAALTDFKKYKVYQHVNSQDGDPSECH